VENETNWTVIQFTSGRHEKFDDDDGHYIVTPDTPLTERCR
jgi:dual-specificity kinase